MHIYRYQVVTTRAHSGNKHNTKKIRQIKETMGQDQFDVEDVYDLFETLDVTLSQFATLFLERETTDKLFLEDLNLKKKEE